MTARLGLWAISSVIPVVLAVVFAARAHRREWATAIGCSVMAALPGATIFTVAFLIALFRVPWADFPPEEGKGIGSSGLAGFFALGLVPAGFSYFVVPPGHWPRRFEILRLSHVAEGLTWFALVTLAP